MDNEPANANLSAAEVLFNAALKYSGAERTAYLANACEDNPQLRQQVEALLQAHEEAASFLPEEPQVSATVIAPSEKLGDKIGRYKLLQKIGEGGCGVVYMAEQEESVRRRVALKIIKMGMDTRSVIARFEAERQALALMDHPNIAKVLDAGATETGRPYFVMELVRGIKVTDYCDQHNLSTGERLDLFLHICRAIQHAHQKGIIHRDIKPSNILVTLHDGVPIPKVIDFGIAKATTDQRLTDKTLFTAFEQFIGTPAYMSPEQAEMSGLDIDTRSDIYSLGVLLYELLTGEPPFDPKELVRAGLDEMRRIIREKEPVRPSTRLGTMLAADLVAVAKHRHADPPKLIHNLRGDLDWIVMKTLEKDRTRRYETANGLAMDIERHLKSEPVVACPPSNLYRFQKLVRRNKLACVAVSAVLAALVSGLGISTWQFVEKSKAYRRAVTSEQAAEKARADEAKQRQQAVEARNNEASQREKAEAAGARLAEAVDQLEIRKAEDLFSANNASAALAYLARVLRRTPTNALAAERLLSALTYRHFILPVAEPIGGESEIRFAKLSPDGHRVATVSEDNAVQVWDANTAQALTAPIRHELKVDYAFFSSDALRLVTVYGDEKQNSARIWDAQTGLALTGPFTRAARFLFASFSPDGQRLLTVFDAKIPRVWDARTGQLLSATLPHEEKIRAVEFSEDGKRMVTVLADKTAQVWDPTTGQPLIRLKHQSNADYASFSPDGQKVLIRLENDAAQVCDANTGEPLAAPIRFDSLLNYTVFSPDGQRLLTVYGSRNTRIWDARTGAALSDPISHEGRWVSASFSPDGQRMLTASGHTTPRLWDAVTGQPLNTPLRNESEVLEARFSTDGLRLLTTGSDKAARIWDGMTGRPTSEPIGRESGTLRAELSSDGLRLLTTSEDKRVRVWDAATGEALPLPLGHQTWTSDTPGHESWLLSAQFSPDGRWVVTTSTDKTARIADAKTGRPLFEVKHEGWVRSAQFSSDGQRLITASEDNTARIWDCKTGEILAPPLNHEDAVRFAQFSPDGRLAVTASDDKTGRIWDGKTGRALTPPLKHEGQLLYAEFSPDGHQIVTASEDNTARVWDAMTGQPLTNPLRHKAQVISAKFSPDGQLVLTACGRKRLSIGHDGRLIELSGDRTALVWDAKTGGLVSKLGHEASVQSAQFSADGQRVVTASEDKTARVWDIKTGEPLTGPLKHEDGVCSAQFSPDGRRVVTACLDMRIRVWDATTGHPLSEPFRHPTEVIAAQFSPDGQQVLTVSWDNTARIWEVPALPLPVPNWIPRLAEAIAQNRMNDWGRSEHLAMSEIQALKRQLAEKPITNAWTRWVGWFFSDPGRRTISPFCDVTMPECIERQTQSAERLIRQDILESLREAVKLAPTNVLAHARLARAILHQKQEENPHQLCEADWYSARALRLGPNDAEALWARAEFCERAGQAQEAHQMMKTASRIQPRSAELWAARARMLERTTNLSEALEAINGALELQPLNPEFWNIQGRMLEKAQQITEAYNSFTKAIELANDKSRSITTDSAKFYLSRSAFLKRQNRLPEAAKDVCLAKNIPMQAPQAKPEQLDLSPHYNASLTEDWHPQRRKNNLASLPTGLQTFAGVIFDVRGLIQVGRESQTGEKYPKRVEGIQIKHKCARLYFLHSAIDGYSEPYGTAIGSYVIHFANGQHREIPIVVGKDLADWFKQPSEDGAEFVVAWEGANEVSRQLGSKIRLFKTTWENPSPEVAIESLDFVSRDLFAAPFLVAITLE